jgi:hypothetical protein
MEKLSSLHTNIIIIGKLLLSIQWGLEFFSSVLIPKGRIRAGQHGGEKRVSGEGMANINGENRLRWLRINSGVKDKIDDPLEMLVEQTEEEKWVSIGQWYYYLYVHNKQIDLCRTQGKIGQPSLTEVMKPVHLAISDDDLEYAVHYGSGGTFDSGHYRISPLIERKLRILFE